MVREYVQVSGCGSIEALIAALEAVKSQVPPGSSDAKVRLRGGRKISPSWSAAPVSRFG